MKGHLLFSTLTKRPGVMGEAAILCFHSRPSAHDQNVPQAFRSGLRASSVVALLSRFFRLDSSQDSKDAVLDAALDILQGTVGEGEPYL